MNSLFILITAVIFFFIGYFSGNKTIEEKIKEIKNVIPKKPLQSGGIKPKTAVEIKEKIDGTDKIRDRIREITNL